MSRHRLTWIAASAGALIAGTAAAASPQRSEVLLVPTHAGIQAIEVDAPEAPASRARAVETGARAAIERLHSRVIVRSAAGEAPLRGLGLKSTPVADLPEFRVVEAGSVRAAVALARRLDGRKGVVEAYVDAEAALAPRVIPNDPALPLQWHLINQLPESDPLFDINADAAWIAGYTGAGVVVGVIDGGYNLGHPDLTDNHVPEASLENFGSNNHGTSVAGIIAAVGNNGQGGAGVAYEAGLGRLYYTGGSSVIASSLLHRNDLISVKNNSWGPTDNGIVRTMPSIERAAIEQAIATGRGGKGEIIVWAGGNGALLDDRADYDPYTTSRFTIAVGAINSADQASVYSEPGSCILVCAPSDNDLMTTSDDGIYTTTNPTGYTPSFGGTSAAAPVASGLVALILEANPCLTWRDVQHILVESARRNDPTDTGWTLNGAARYVHEKYGFGAIDAGAATALAAQWPGTPPEISVSSPTVLVGVPLPDSSPAGVTRQIEIDSPLVIESVEVTLDVTHPFIGDLSIVLTSPTGTQSVLAGPRSDFTANYADHLFTSMRHWGEPAAGLWTLTIADERAGSEGAWINWRLTFNGTDPAATVCPCEWDGAAGVSVFDLLGYLDGWFALEDEADLNCSGGVDVFDLIGYLDCWFAGCP